MKKLATYLKGIALGFVSIAIPGLSASTMGIELGVYYDMIDSIANLRKMFRKSALFLTFLILGYLSGSFGGAIAVNTVYKFFPIVLVLLIMGFVIGGIPQMSKELKPGLKKSSCWITLIVIIAILIVFSFCITNGKVASLEKSDMHLRDYFLLLGIGFITAATLVVPGVDFAVMLIAIGYYDAFTGIIASTIIPSEMGHAWLVLGIYFLGYGVGCVVFSKIVKALITRFDIQTKFASYAFVISAPAIIIKKSILDNDEFTTNTLQIVIGIVLFIAAFFAMYFLLKKFDNDRKKALELEKSDIIEENKEVVE